MKRRLLSGLVAVVAGLAAIVAVSTPTLAATPQTMGIGSDNTWTVDGTGTSVVIDPGCNGGDSNPWGWRDNPFFAPGQPMWDRACPLTGNGVEHHVFSKTFNVPGSVVSAHLNYSIDNIGSASVNGTQVGSISCWCVAVSADVTSLLHAGSNTVVIDAIDQGGIAATTLGLTISYSSGHVVQTKDDCKNGGWANVTRPDGSSFKNQGDCVSYVASGGKSDAR